MLLNTVENIGTAKISLRNYKKNANFEQDSQQEFHLSMVNRDILLFSLACGRAKYPNPKNPKNLCFENLLVFRATGTLQNNETVRAKFWHASSSDGSKM